MTVPASLLVSSGLCVAASACASTGLAFDATFAVSAVFLARVLRPELVDGVFAHVDAWVLREARHASAAVVSEARLLRDDARADPVIAPIYARAEERVRRAYAFVADGFDGLMSTARAKWSGFKEAAVAAFFWLRLIAGLINLAATVLFTIACQEAKSRAPSVLGWRGVKAIRSRPAAAVSPAGSRQDTMLLVVWISAILMYCTQVLVFDAICSGITTFAACFGCLAALCGFALMEAERVYLWGTYDIATAIASSTASSGRRVGSAAAGGGITAIDMRDAWEYLWSHIIVTYVLEVCFLQIVLGNQPLALASLAIYNLAALEVAREAYQTPDIDGEETNGSTGGAQGGVNEWQGAAMTVLAIDVAKVVGTYLVLDFHLGALCFLPLCFTTTCLFIKAVCLSDARASDGDGGDVDQERVGLAGDAARDDTERPDDDVRAEDSSTAAAGSVREEEGTVMEEPAHIVSDSEEHVEEEQRDEESDYSSSSSMNDWSFVYADPAMPIKVDDGAGGNRKFRFLS